MDVLPRLTAALGAVVLLTGCSSSGGPTAAAPGPPSPAVTSSASPAPAAGPVLLALGDSVAAGTGALRPAAEGYVPVLAGLLSDPAGCGGGRAGCRVQVRNLAVPGATTSTLLQGQLPEALEVLAQQDVRAVTVTVGGNDVFVPVLRACGQTPQAPSCADAVRVAVASVDGAVDRLVEALTGAAGPGTPVAVMTYYDPLGACRLAALQPLAERVLEGTAGQDGLNDVLRARAAEHGAVVVETGDALGSPADLVGGLDCLHPSTSGHAQIAERFARALEADRAG